ncbi:MAG: DNA polymerase III subunit alpha [Proteobacteria bacterium]|nr:DNA polymerase III subunit alpha [Pseudomonadota bacterium]
MAGSFAHLHLHSQYSLLDGAIRLKDLYPRLHELGMKSVALTDHGNMFGALDFYKTARKAGIKPIFGCEVYVSDGAMNDRASRKTFHCVLLARTLEGYRNLVFLVSKAYLEGFYYHPRIDKQLLREHSAGLIGLSACLGGEVAQTLLRQGSARALEVVREYRELFEPGAFFLEVQPNGLNEQNEVNEALVKLAAQTNLPLVATNDCHYLARKDARAHDCLMCVQTGKQIEDKDRIKHEVDEYFLKSPEEMEQAFYHLPQAIENAARIAESCNVDLALGQSFLPRYQVPAGFELGPFLEQQVREGLDRRLVEARARGQAVDEKVYRERAAHELEVIGKMGFSSYFLIVWDFINYAKQRGVPVGPGRGSGAGSLVAYALRITDIDPLPYNLLFERFLNPERVSMPDFDIDFCMHRRDEVLQYVSEKYGRDNVGQIVTMHQLKARGVTRDVARAMGFSYAEADRVAKLIPEPIQGRSVTIEQALEQEPRLRQLAGENPRVAELLDVASGLEGLNRHAGTHAAGVVIAERPLWEYVPCFRGPNGELVTQYAKNEVEEAGLVKFDFLGLKTLTVVDIAARLVCREVPEFRLDAVPLTDAETFAMLQSGLTTGVFQLESSGFKELLKRLQPDCFEDIVAAVALYRPGPLEGGMVDDFIDRKHGRKPVDYLHPWLAEILKETYGVIVYQEQVMQIASRLAGYTLGQADLLRRAMGKKKPEEMAEQRKIFLAGASARGVGDRLAEQIFDLMDKFAGYGFNKSHSVAYAFLSYQTAWLKCHYPVEFMAAMLTCDKDNTDNLTKYITEARKMGIEVVRPDVDESESDFSVIARGGPKFIRFGMGAVRNVGEAAVQAVLEVRQERPFGGLFDFCERVDGRRVNKRVVEALIKAGAFDGTAERLKLHRAQLVAALDEAQEQALTAQRDRESGQTSLFGLLDGGSTDQTTATRQVVERYPIVAEWAPRQRLAFERESLGFYVSGHPLDRYAEDLRRHASATTVTLAELADRAEVSVGGIVGDYRERPLKSGKGRMAIFGLEDLEGQVEVVCFSRAFEEHEATIKSGEPLLVTGRLRFEGEGEGVLPRIDLQKVMTLDQFRVQKTKEVHLTLSGEGLAEAQLEALQRVLREHQGDCRTYVHLRLAERSTALLELAERWAVNPTDDFLLQVEQLFGERTALLR